MEHFILPFAIADGSSYIPAIKATCPGLDSVGTFVCETPHVPRVLNTLLKYGAFLSPFLYNDSARRPSATNNMRRLAGACPPSYSGACCLEDEINGERKYL